jgi:hypothetical protein
MYLHDASYDAVPGEKDTYGSVTLCCDCDRGTWSARRIQRAPQSGSGSLTHVNDDPGSRPARPEKRWPHACLSCACTTKVCTIDSHVRPMGAVAIGHPHALRNMDARSRTNVVQVPV